MTHPSTNNPSDSFRTECPTGSFDLVVPIAALSDDDEHVFSYWIHDHPLLLQISSHRRFHGAQVNAANRLRAFLERQPLVSVSPIPDVSVESCDFAACKGLSDDREVWVYAYAVWPDLAVMITVSGDAQLVNDHENWAFTAIRSLRRIYPS